MRITAFYNLKGGVGKTAAAVNIAYLAAKSGLNTLVWDLDPQGAASCYFRIRPAPKKAKASKLISGDVPIGRLVQQTVIPRLDLIPADFSYRKMDLLFDRSGKTHDQLYRIIEPFSESYALVILDCPPSISRLSENVFVAADALCVPLIPTFLSVHAYQQLCEYLKKHNISRKHVYSFFSMVDRRRKLHREFLESPEALPGHVLHSYIPYSATVERMGEHLAPVGLFAPRDPVSEAYEQLWNEIVQHLKLTTP